MAGPPGNLMADDIDNAQRLADAFCEVGIAKARRTLDVQGPDECKDCGAVIEPRRRIAMPSATRCIACQGQYERATRARGR